MRAEAERFCARQRSPQFGVIEARYGKPISSTLRELYSDMVEIQRESVTRVVPGRPVDEPFYFCWYEPLDQESLDGQWDFASNLFEFANDGSGNKYAVDPTEPTGEIFFVDHETSEVLPTGVHIHELRSLAEPPEES